MGRKNILFVCKYNRFRSRIAKAYFDKIKKNENFKADSVGVIKGKPVGKKEWMFAKKYGLDISGDTKGLSAEMLSKTDILIIVADDVPKTIFKLRGRYPMKVILWKIKDEYRSLHPIIIKEIVKRVDSLVKTLENGKGK